MDSCVSSEVFMQANPHDDTLSCDAEGVKPKSADVTLPRKVSRVNLLSARTDNRHR